MRVINPAADGASISIRSVVMHKVNVMHRIATNYGSGSGVARSSAKAWSPSCNTPFKQPFRLHARE